MKKTSFFLAAFTSLGLAACSQPNMNSAVYTPSAAMRAQNVQMGTITGVRSVEIRHMTGNSDAVMGAIAGGAAGALLGDQFGKGKGNALVTGIGAVAGAAAGGNVAQRANRIPAQEWTVRLDSGRTIAVVQNDAQLSVGQYVRVIDDGARTRLAP